MKNSATGSRENKAKELFFSPGAMSIIHMGEELIGHPTTAINELVKNAYDADANICNIYFHIEKSSNESFLILKDDGIGMDQDLLFGKWLQPSVSEKRKDGVKSKKYKRSFLGNKGIGRLAAMSLGQFITVITRKNSKAEYSWLTLDRESFRTEGKFLSEVTFPGDSISNYENLFSDGEILEVRNSKKNETLLSILKRNSLDRFNSGTLIIVENLDINLLLKFKEEFGEESFLNIEESFDIKSSIFYKSLESLISPIKISSSMQEDLFKEKIISEKKLLSNSSDNFSVNFGISLFKGENDKIIEWRNISPIPIHSNFNYRAFGKVTGDGRVESKFIYNRIEDNFFPEDLNISSEDLGLIRNNSEGENLKLFETNRKSETNVGEFYFDIRIYDMGEDDNVEALARRSNLKDKSAFRKAFKKIQGLRVIKNGFGVKPYGEEYEDWIGLSKARVDDPGKNLNTKQIVGYVLFYSPENDTLEEKTNREGFLENLAFEEVKNSLQAIFKIIGRKRYNYRLMHGLGRTPHSKHSRPDFEEYMQILNEKLEGKTSPDEIKSHAKNFMENVQTAMDNLEQSLSFSERLASLGSGIELVYHEMGQPISNLQTTKSSLKLKSDKIPIELFEKYKTDINLLEDSADTFISLRNSLRPAIGKSQIKKFKPKDTFLKVCSLFKADIYKSNDEIEIQIPSEFLEYEIKDQEYAFWVAFLNIINNSIYWIRKVGTKGRIKIAAEDDAIVISNNGPNIQEDIIDIIFEYGVTGKIEKNATGLGLAYTQSVLSNIDWEIFAENRNDGPAFIIKRSKK